MRKMRASHYTYADYEQAKREWQRRHPAASHAEYQQAMSRIARRMGL
jgi:hypothetical protein